MTAIEQITDLQTQVATLTEEVAVLTADSAKHNEALNASVVALTEQRDALQAAGEKLVAEHAEALAAITAERDAALASLAENATEIEAARAEIAKMTGRLRDPAFDAAAIEESISAPAGAEGGASHKTRDQWNAEYNALPSATREDAQARAEFRKAHKSELGL